MEELRIQPGDPSPEELKALEERCKRVISKLESEESEVKLPVIVEFSGSPKSGKSSIIEIVGHFFKRMGMEVTNPPEGASVRNPPGLRDDWLASNAWSGCYALQHILIDCSTDPPQTLLILDRGLFDVAGWMEFLCKHLQRITEGDRDAILNFFGLDLWFKRENAVFLFTADHATSLKRENRSKLTQASGSVMNAEILAQLQMAYTTTAERLKNHTVRIFHLDTSEKHGAPISFQRISALVAEKILQILEDLTSQMLLVTAPAQFSGFNADPEIMRQTAKRILDEGPNFVERDKAEATTAVQQIVPYAILENLEGKFFMARRRSDARRQELRGKWTLLVGGHAEQRDFDPRFPDQVFEHCLRRELDEELIGIQIQNIQPLGFINDARNAMGAHHLAFIHRAKVDGRMAIRRQAIDKEFGRESISWRTSDEICHIAGDLDPWSQLVAASLFGANIPTEQQDLFTPKPQ